MYRVAIMAMVFATALGCQKSTPPPHPSGVTGTVGGAIAGVKGAVDRTVTLNELNNLRLFIDTASNSSGKMPTKAEVLAVAAKEDKKLHGFLSDGTIVMTGTKSRDGVWAYVAEAIKTNGYVVTSSGIERKTSAELKQMLAASP